MALCPHCNAVLPEGMRFCLQCGARLAETSPATTLEKQDAKPLEEPRRTSTGRAEVVCRFCKAPLALEGEFCEQCGAPLAEAAPSGITKPKAPPAAEAGVQAAPTPPQPVSAAQPIVFREAPQPAKATSAAQIIAPPPSAAPKPPAVELPPRQMPSPEPGPTPVSTSLTLAAVMRFTKNFPVSADTVGIGLGVVVVVIACAAWYLHRSGTVHEQPPTPVVAPATLPTQPQVAVVQPPKETPTLANQPRKPHTSKSASPLAFPAPAANPKAAQITGLQSLARGAYAKGNYAEPVEANAITYSKHVLELAPSDGYAKTLLENSVNGGEYQAQQAIRRKDFATAHRVANALAQLLPGRNDIAELQKDISIAEAANDSARRSQPIPVVAFRAYHLHSDKAPEDGGPHCLGTLSVVGQEIKFRGESASDEHIHSLDFTCSDIREIKKNSRVASRQGGFHVRTASRNVNFAPEDSSREHVAVLASACSQ